MVTCVVRGCPKGLGMPVFGKLEAELAGAVMSLPASKVSNSTASEPLPHCVLNQATWTDCSLWAVRLMATAVNWCHLRHDVLPELVLPCCCWSDCVLWQIVVFICPSTCHPSRRALRLAAALVALSNWAASTMTSSSWRTAKCAHALTGGSACISNADMLRRHLDASAYARAPARQSRHKLTWPYILLPMHCHWPPGVFKQT